MGKYRSAPVVVFISYLEIRLLLKWTTKCHQILCPYPTLSIFFTPLSRPFPVPYIHICGWIVWCSSAMMKDDICDKGTDHKLSNHSRNCLLAAPLVMLSTLPHVCVTPPERHRAALLSWTHLVSVYFDGNKSESHCGQRHYKPTLSSIKHLLASLSRSLSLSSAAEWEICFYIFWHVNKRMQKRLCV